MGKIYLLNTMENCKVLLQKPCKYFSKIVNLSTNSNGLLLVVLFAFSFTSSLYAQTEIITTTGAGTWTSPVGVTSFTVEIWGGGGAGGGCTAIKNKGASGGTGGTYVSKTYTPASATTYNLLVGAQTAGSAGIDGANGSFSWFSTTGTQYANGGLGGKVGTGAAVTAVTTGSIGTMIVAGGSTLIGGTNTGSAGGNGGNGGGTGGAITPDPGANNSTNGYAGNTPGGGGSGAATGGGGGPASTTAGGTGARGEIRITYLKITSLGTTGGCVGSSMTINGTDFIGATASNITIGGTPVTSITSNTGTQIIAVIGAGTTGTVSITIAGKGIATSSATFTVNPSPSISTQPVATSVCTFGSTTFNVTASGVTTYQWRRNGVNLTNVAPYSNVTTATLTITNPVVGDAGNFDVVLNSATCPLTSSTVALAVNTIPTASITPSPTSGATNICYSGVGAITSISWAATASATSYDVYFGTAISPVTLSANVSTNSYTTGALAANTTYYWRIVAKNACGSATTSATWSFTTAGSVCTPTYCTVGGITPATSYISNVTLNTINQNNSAWNGYINYYPTISTNVIQANNYTISVTIWNNTTSQKNISAWIDWNFNGVFDVATETVLSTTSTVASPQSVTVTNTFTVPGTAVVELTRLRVELAFNTEGAATPCNTNSLTDAQDYKINVQQILPCNTPTAQPTSFILVPSGTSIGGSFTAPAPAPNNYLVIINTTGVAPTPVNGITYVVGGTVGAGNTVVDIDTDTNFVATGLSLSTTYYLFVYSFNSLCSGGPLYLTTAPLNGTTTTLATNYCIPTGNLNCSTNSDYIANVTLNTLNNNTTCTSSGYTNFAATGAQTTTLTRGNTYNLSLGTGPGNKKHGAAVWIDFNQNSVFTDAGEYFFIGNGVIANSTNTIAIAVPAGATLGTTRMRVRYGRQTNVASTSSCTMSGTFGETEDYSITIINPIVCVAPTTQPTALILNSTGTTITGSFTAAIPVPNNYLVVINTTGVAPTPVNATTYIAGGTVGAGNIVVDVDSNTGFVASGLTALTTYYVFVFAYNSACSGGPTYNTTTPLNGNIATIAANYCIPSVTSGQQSLGYFSEISFVGTLNDVSNYSTFSTTPLGYQDFTGLTNLSRQAQGEGVNISIQALNSSFIKAWVDWNKDGDFLDTGELVYNTGGISTYSTTFGFIIPSAQALGNYRIRIRCNSRDTSGTNVNSTDVFTSCGNINYGGETEDYLFTVIASCNSVITTVTDGRTCGPGTVNLIATSTSVGVTQYRWYTTPTGSTLVGTTSTGSWTTPSISSTTTYYVTAFNGCESLVRTALHAIVSPIPTLTYYPTNPIVCGEDTGVELSATGDVEEVFLIDEKFTSGLGTFTNTNIVSTAENTNSQWQNHSSTFVLTPITNYNVWFPAISTGINGNGFAMSTSDVGGVTIHNQIASATLNSTSFTSLTLSMRLFYSRYYEDGNFLGLDYVTIDVSTNGGAAWTEIKRYTEDVGIGTRFESVSFDLSSYINQTNLKIRVRYYGEWCDGLAVDDIKFYGNRPSTDLNWTTAIPAYTDAACTIPYDSNFTASTIYVKPSLSQLELGSFSFLATAILSNGCSTSQTITITNTSKIWQGGTNWQTAANWKPVGVPDATNCVIIPSTAVIPGSSYQAFAKNLTIKPTGNLEILSTSNLTVTDFVNINTLGVFTIRNNASLVQINDAAANSITGTFTMDRTTTLRKTDYVYWSSPVAGFSASAISSGTNPYYIWKWNPSIGNTNGGFGNWVSGNETMSAGKGYIVRGPDTFTSTAAPFTTTFSGVLHNGIKQPTITRGTYTGANYVGTNGATITSNDDNWNLVGNPFPSAIDAKEFLDLNTNIAGNVRLWTHGTNIALGGSTFYGSFTYNYNTSDYVNFNGTGSTPPGFNGKIGAAQGFFVLMNEATAVTETVTFNNSLRTDALGNAFNNSQFYRTNNSNSTADNVSEKNLIWLSLINSTNIPTTTLVGYVENATYDQDRLFDAPHKSGNSASIYSMISDESMIIQGRPNPFNSTDLVPIGVTIPNSGVYNIAISKVDGLFETTNQGIYLEDTALGIIHDLRNSPYTFNANTGTFTNRFILRYTNDSALGVGTTSENQTFAFISNNQLQVQSSENIQMILLYDISGKLVNTYQPSEAKTHFDADFLYAKGAYIAKITLKNGNMVSTKLLH